MLVCVCVCVHAAHIMLRFLLCVCAVFSWPLFFTPLVSDDGCVSTSTEALQLDNSTLDALLSESLDALTWTFDDDVPTVLVCVREVAIACFSASLDGWCITLPALLDTVVNAVLQIHISPDTIDVLGSILLCPSFLQRYSTHTR